jgi:UDP-glucose 4-epimerase
MAFFLVTGGAGFIGSHIVEALVRRGDRVRVLDNFSSGKRANLSHIPGVEIIEGDVRDAGVVCQAASGIDFILHLAAMVSVPQSMADPIGAHAINVTGTLNVLLAAREFGAQRVVLSSSCAVYGDNEVLPLGETDETLPMSPYATTKLMGETYCQLFWRAYGVPTTCLRYFNIYGPRQDPASEYAAVIPKFTQRMRLGQSPLIFGDGLQTRDFVHVADVAKANLLACECDTAKGQVLNVASGHGTSLIELVDTLNTALGTSIQPVFAATRVGDIKHSRGDAARMAAVLNFRPGISLAAGLSSVVAGQLAQTEKQ